MRGKFESKLIVSQIIIVICLILLLVGLFYSYVVKDMTWRTREDFDTITSKTVTQFDALLYNMDKTALQVAANPSIVSVFQTMNKEPGNYFLQERSVNAYIVKLLNSYNFKRDSFARICLYNDNEDYVCTATTVTTASGMKNYLESEYFIDTQKHFQQNGKYMHYLAPKEDMLNDTGMSKRSYFSIVREIKDYSSNSSKCGYVEVQEYFDKIEYYFGNLGEMSYALVLDGGKNVIYESSLLEQDKTSAESAAVYLERIRANELMMGTDYEDGFYYSYQKVGNSPFTVLFLKHEGGLIKPMTRFSMVVIVVMIFSLVLALVVEILLIRRLSRPLIKLRDTISELNVNHYTMDMEESKNSDELQQIQDAFNNIFQELKDTMDKHYIAKNNELKSHLFALQSQMNPHFMHNILAIISMEAGVYGSRKTQLMCEKLCRMLSFTTSMQDGFCFLKDEIHNACDYMDLMKERYEELFEYTIDMEDSLANVRIPKLIVQPICENCFNHGFKMKEPVWKIVIRSYAEDGKWLIEIRDNGTGFPADYLEEVRRMQEEVTLENVKEKLENIKIGGLCIPNIYMRLKISYGDSFICRMENDAWGAKVILGGRLDD